MRRFKTLVLLTGLAAAAPKPQNGDVDTTGTDSLNSMPANFTLASAEDSKLAAVNYAYHGEEGFVDLTVPDYNLPDNVPQDFWTRKYPPSKSVKKEDNLPFEILHCDGTWDDNLNRVSGTCHYQAGEVARDSELILAMAGTRSMVANCDLRSKMAVGWRPWTWFWPDYRTTALPNGLCYYDNRMNMDYIRITN